MTLTKIDIVKNVRRNVSFKNRLKSPQQYLFPEMNCTFLSQSRANDVVNSLFETIKQALAKGESVIIPGFGKFQVKFKWPRKGRNPQTGEMIILKSRRTISFKVSPKLKEKLNLHGQIHKNI
jgi:integration host factor subunit alpha